MSSFDLNFVLSLEEQSYFYGFVRAEKDIQTRLPSLAAVNDRNPWTPSHLGVNEMY